MEHTPLVLRVTLSPKGVRSFQVTSGAKRWGELDMLVHRAVMPDLLNMVKKIRLLARVDESMEPMEGEDE